MDTTETLNFQLRNIFDRYRKGEIKTIVTLFTYILEIFNKFTALIDEKDVDIARCNSATVQKEITLGIQRGRAEKAEKRVADLKAAKEGYVTLTVEDFNACQRAKAEIEGLKAKAQRLEERLGLASFATGESYDKCLKDEMVIALQAKLDKAAEALKTISSVLSAIKLSQVGREMFELGTNAIMKAKEILRIIEGKT